MQQNLEVELPAGGKLQLRNQEEVDLWERTSDRYKRDYALTKTNDLITLGILLTQHLTVYRSQQALSGMVPQTDAQGVPTGKIVYKEPSAEQAQKIQKTILEASKDIREAEKSLGIDKRTRDAGGGEDIAQYIQNLKMAGRQLGVHITKRTKAYEEFCMELRWKLRVFKNGDEEDKAEHNLTADTILDFAEQRLQELEQIDQDFANQKQRLFVGKL